MYLLLSGISLESHETKPAILDQNCDMFKVQGFEKTHQISYKIGWFYELLPTSINTESK